MPPSFGGGQQSFVKDARTKRTMKLKRMKIMKFRTIFSLVLPELVVALRITITFYKE